MMPTIDELLSLDQLTLRAHTEQAGDIFALEQQRARLQVALPDSRICWVRSGGLLVAYAMMRPESQGDWFVTAFNTHPMHRTAPVLQELFAKFAALAHELGISKLKSHVYKTNRLSMSFHNRLAFRVTKENAKAVEFVTTLEELSASPVIKRTSRRFGSA